MASHNWILKCEQYVAHRKVKIARQGARKEVEFGLEIFDELKKWQTDDFYYGFDDICTCERCVPNLSRYLKV